MPARRISHQADAIRIDPEIGRLGTHELDRRLHVVDRARIRSGLAQPIIDAEHHIAILGEVRAPIAVAGAAAVLPAAAMHRDDRWRLGESFGLIEVGDELHAVVLRIFHIRLRDDLVFRLGGGRRRDGPRGESEHKPGFHGALPFSQFGHGIAANRPLSRRGGPWAARDLSPAWGATGGHTRAFTPVFDGLGAPLRNGHGAPIGRCPQPRRYKMCARALWTGARRPFFLCSEPYWSEGLVQGPLPLILPPAADTCENE